MTLDKRSAEKAAEAKGERAYAARKALRRVKSPQRKRDFIAAGSIRGRVKGGLSAFVPKTNSEFQCFLPQ
jgi:hypothetical protein